MRANSGAVTAPLAHCASAFAIPMRERVLC
jgi:hypothetical protein